MELRRCLCVSDQDPFVQKKGKGPSSSELTGEDSGDEKEKKKEAKKNGGTPQKEELSEDQKKVVPLVYTHTRYAICCYETGHSSRSCIILLLCKYYTDGMDQYIT